MKNHICNNETIERVDIAPQFYSAVDVGYKVLVSFPSPVVSVDLPMTILVTTLNGFGASV